MKKIKELAQIKTEHLILRKAKEDDINHIWKNVWSDKDIAENMLWKVTKTLKEAEIRIEKTIKYHNENYAYFVCLKTNNEPIGFAGIFEKEKGIYEETGICIAKKYQKKGYAKEVVNIFKDIIFTKLDGKRFIYGCFNTNEASRKVCISQGFKYFKSESIVRDHDKKKFISDYYYFDKDMYFKEEGVKDE